MSFVYTYAVLVGAAAFVCDFFFRSIWRRAEELFSTIQAYEILLFHRFINFMDREINFSLSSAHCCCLFCCVLSLLFTFLFHTKTQMHITHHPFIIKLFFISLLSFLFGICAHLRRCFVSPLLRPQHFFLSIPLLLWNPILPYGCLLLIDFRKSSVALETWASEREKTKYWLLKFYLSWIYAINLPFDIVLCHCLRSKRTIFPHASNCCMLGRFMLIDDDDNTYSFMIHATFDSAVGCMCAFDIWMWRAKSINSKLKSAMPMLIMHTLLYF